MSIIRHLQTTQYGFMRRPTTPEDNTDCDEWADYVMQDAPNAGAPH